MVAKKISSYFLLFFLGITPTARTHFYDNSLPFIATVATAVAVSKVAYDTVSLLDTQLPQLYNKLFVKKPVVIPDPCIKVGLLKICGDIWESEKIHEYLRKIEECGKDDSIAALFVYINSYGGCPGLSELLFRELCNLKMKKPVVTVIDNACYSGAYLVACAADQIIATSTAEVGNVGVRNTLKHFAEFPEETVGQEKGKTETLFIKAGKFKVAGNMYEKLTDEEKTYFQDIVNQHYAIFCQLVADARSLSLDDRETWADGKIFVAQEAVTIGLIDSCGSWTYAQKIMRMLIKEKNPNVDGPLKIVTI